LSDNPNRISRQSFIFATVKKIMNMRPIQMVDLQQQYQHIKNEVNNALNEVLESAALLCEDGRIFPFWVERSLNLIVSDAGAG